MDTESWLCKLLVFYLLQIGSDYGSINRNYYSRLRLKSTAVPLSHARIPQILRSWSSLQHCLTMVGCSLGTPVDGSGRHRCFSLLQMELLSSQCRTLPQECGVIDLWIMALLNSLLASSDIDVLKSDFSCGSFSETCTRPAIGSRAEINGVAHSGLVLPLNNELFRERFLFLKMGNALEGQAGRNYTPGWVSYLSGRG